MNNETTKSKKPGTKIPTREGHLLVNFHGVFFFMTHLGKYIPWSRTLKCGEVMFTNEYGRLKNLIGPEKQKFLTPFQEKRAAVHAAGLTKDPLYKLTDEQKESVALSKEAFSQGVTVEEMLVIKEKRRQRAEKKALTSESLTDNKTPVIKVRTDDVGRTGFVLGSLPIFEKLRQKMAVS